MAKFNHSILSLWGFHRYLGMTDDDGNSIQDRIDLWDGEYDLTWDGRTWTGLGRPGGSLLAIENIHAQQGLALDKLSIRLSVADPALAIFWAHDFTGLQAQAGHITSTDSGRSWFREPQQLRGRLSELAIQDGIAEGVIASYLDNLDRGIVAYYSDATQQARSPGDTGLYLKARLAEGIDLESWPP